MKYVKYEIGEKLPFDFPIGQDYAKFGYTDSMLFLGCINPSLKEIRSVKSESLILKLIERPHALYLIFKFNNMDWMDAPYSICLFPKEKMKILEEKVRAGVINLLTVVLTDSRDNTIKVLRAIALSDNFARELQKAVLNQCERSHTVEEHKRDIAQIYQQYSSEQLAHSDFVISTCKIEGKLL